MSEMQNFSGSDKRILFLGREKCTATEDVLNNLVRYGFDVTFIKSRKRGEKPPEDICWSEGEYILFFRSLFVPPKRLIDKASIAAINFHPAPPEYPGSGCINFTLYDELKNMGCLLML
jgi:hypothetical protein